MTVPPIGPGVVLTSCFLRRENREQLECQGSVQDKITVCATDDSYQMTRERMSQVEKDIWSRTAIEIKPGSTYPSTSTPLLLTRPLSSLTFSFLQPFSLSFTTSLSFTLALSLPFYTSPAPFHSPSYPLTHLCLSFTLSFSHHLFLQSSNLIGQIPIR